MHFFGIKKYAVPVYEVRSCTNLVPVFFNRFLDAVRWLPYKNFHFSNHRSSSNHDDGCLPIDDGVSFQSFERRTYHHNNMTTIIHIRYLVVDTTINLIGETQQCNDTTTQRQRNGSTLSNGLFLNWFLFRFWFLVSAFRSDEDGGKSSQQQQPQ